MQAVQIGQEMPVYTMKRKSSLECSCEKSGKKCFHVCEVCSEKNYSKSLSNIHCSSFIEWE